MTLKAFKNSHPATWIPTLYFAMGLPLVALSQASAIMYKDLGVSDSDIAFWTTLIMLPWSLKPLWSPILEMFKTKKYFVLLTQFVTGVCFAIAALALPMPDFFRYTIALFAVVAFSGATHDIAADGLYMNVLDSKDQSKYIGWQGAAYNFAKIVSGGALVYLAGILQEDHGLVFAWKIVLFAYALIMIILGAYHVKMLPSGSAAEGISSLSEGFKVLGVTLKSFFQKKMIAAHILFIILYRFAEGFAIKIAPLFFKASLEDGGLGLSNEQYGLVYGVFGAAAFVIGSILGGYYIASRGLKNTLFKLALIFNIPFAVYAIFAYFQPQNMVVISAGVICEYFGYGFGFVGLTLFIMQQIAPGKYKTAHYAFASGIMNLGYMIPGMISGYLSDAVGYRIFFIIVMVATVPAILAAKFVPFTRTVEVEN